MRNSKQNSILILVSLILDIGAKIGETFGVLFLGKTGSSRGIVWSMLHHVLVTGPKLWKKHPTSVAMGRGMFTPLVFLFSHPRSPGDSERR